MKRPGSGRIWEREGRRSAFLLAAALLLPLSPGCAPQTRHAVLQFLIDGYPPYMTPEEKVRAEAERLARESALEQTARDLRMRRMRPVRKLARFTHGPFAAKECARCHDLSAASGFRGSRGGGTVGVASAGDLAEGGRLRMPVNELCVRCHTDYTAEDSRNEGRFVHGPVATGWCVLCHEPHSSDHPKLVRFAPDARLCGQCHLRPDLVAFTPEHRPSGPEESFPPISSQGFRAAAEEEAGEVVRVVKDCVRCHDPHRGTDRRLLREIPLSVAPSRIPPSGEVRGHPAGAGAAS